MTRSKPARRARKSACACSGDTYCVLCAPIFRELVDPPGIPAGAPPVVHETPAAPLFRRVRRPPTRAALVAELERLRSDFARLGGVGV